MDSKIIEFPLRNRSASPVRRLIPHRLRDARKAKRMTQSALAEIIGVTRQSISAYEAGEKVPEPENFSRIVNALGQPFSFFTTENTPIFGEQKPHFFRKNGPDTLRKYEACSVLGHWFVQIVKYCDGFVNYPKVDVLEAAPKDKSQIYSTEEIESIAEACRQNWGLGLGPVSNVLALIESKGIAVCRYEMEDEKIDAFSFWNGNRPFIFMASDKESATRHRFDLSHELGHLILHRWVEAEELKDPVTLKRIEAEADSFAGAFLLPRRSFMNEVYTSRLDAFVGLKRRWKVSIQSMIYRCRDLEIIDSDQFTNLYKQISYRKWRKNEPLDDPNILPLEQPKLLRRAIELILEGGRKHPDEILSDLNFSTLIIESFCNLPSGTFNQNQCNNIDPTLK